MFEQIIGVATRNSELLDKFLMENNTNFASRHDRHMKSMECRFDPFAQPCPYNTFDNKCDNLPWI